MKFARLQYQHSTTDSYRFSHWLAYDLRMPFVFSGVCKKSCYTNWANGEPNNIFGQGCALLYVPDWKWKDFQCGFEPYSYICQYGRSSSYGTLRQANVGCRTSR